jgi:hypothetical protein
MHCIERQLHGALRADTEACTLKFNRVYSGEIGIFAVDAETEARSFHEVLSHQ